MYRTSTIYSIPVQMNNQPKIFPLPSYPLPSYPLPSTSITSKPNTANISNTSNVKSHQNIINHKNFTERKIIDNEYDHILRKKKIIYLKRVLYPTIDNDTLEQVKLSFFEKDMVGDDVFNKINELYPSTDDSKERDESKSIVIINNQEYVYDRNRNLKPVHQKLQKYYQGIKHKICEYAKYMPVNSHFSNLNTIHVFKSPDTKLFIGFCIDDVVKLNYNADTVTIPIGVAALLHEIFGHSLQSQSREEISRHAYYGQMYEEYQAELMSIYMTQFDELVRLLATPFMSTADFDIKKVQNDILLHIKNNICGGGQIDEYYQRLYRLIDSLGEFTVENLHENGGFEYIKNQIITINDLIMRRQFLEHQLGSDLFTKFKN